MSLSSTLFHIYHRIFTSQPSLLQSLSGLLQCQEIRNRHDFPGSSRQLWIWCKGRGGGLAVPATPALDLLLAVFDQSALYYFQGDHWSSIINHSLGR